MERRGKVIAAGAGLGALALLSVSLIEAGALPGVDQEALWGPPGPHPRCALVLGAGGVTGAIWEAATIARLTKTEVDPRDAHLVIGTSAGAIIAALWRANLSIDEFFEFAVTGKLVRSGQLLQLPEPMSGHRQVAQPQAWKRQGYEALRAGRIPHLSALVGTAVATGGFGLDPLARVIEQLWSIDSPGLTWPHEPTWIPAVNLANGQREVFGAPGAGAAAIWQAMTASCALPGVIAPGTIDGRKYIDGGILSFTHIDLALAAGARRIIVLSPLQDSPLQLGGGLTSLGLSTLRKVVGSDLSRSLARARRIGVDVVAIHPNADEVCAIGPAHMSFDRGQAIAEAVTRRELLEPAPRWGSAC